MVTLVGACAASVLAGCPGGDGAGGTAGAGGDTGGASGAGGSSGGTGAGGDVTWTILYNTVFGPTGTSTCAANGGCHTVNQSGFQCGTTRSSCYEGMVAAGLINPGPDASTSVIVTPNKSPLCGPLGGTMPKIGKCITSAQLAKIQKWLDAGGQEN